MKNISALKFLLEKNISLSQEIIHSILHQENDCISKSSSSPLRIIADSSEQQKVLELCPASSSSENTPSWSLRLRDGSDEKCLVIEGKDKGQEVRIKGNLYLEGNLLVDGAARRQGGKANWDGGLSDERLKNFSELSGSLEKMKLLRGVSYKWKSETPDKLEHFGLIAQDLQKVEELKDWVTERDGYFYIEPSDGALQLYALTVEAVKELDKRLATVDEAIKEIYQKLEAGTSSLAAITSALADLQLRQLQQDDRIRKIEQKGGN